MALRKPLVLDSRNIEELDANDTLDIGMTRGASTVSDGGTVSHGLGVTPTGVVATGSVSGEMGSVTAKNSNTFTVAIKKHDGTAGTSQAVSWLAFK
jgi:hypothetical protein